jgi:hypothetical protein
MRQFFEFLSIFDWITPTIGFVETFINDPTPLQTNSWTFFVPYDQSLQSGWNAMDIEQLLGQHGIKTWGGQITDGEFFLNVKREQAQWAEYLLLKNGVPLNERFLGAPPPKRKKQQTSPKKQQKSDGNLFSKLDQFLDEWLP